MATGTLTYRLVIVDPANAGTYTPGDATVASDHYVVTSERRVNHPWIASPPEGEGQSIDYLTGKVTDGEYTVRVIDERAPAGGCTLTQSSVVEDLTGWASNGWVIKGDTIGAGYQYVRPASLAGSGGWWSSDGGGRPILGGSALFFWIDYNPPQGGSYSWPPWVRSTWIEKTYGGYTPGEKVGFRFHGDWTLDTGAGNIFAEVNGNRVAFPNGTYDFWTMAPGLGANIQDQVLYGFADGSGNVTVKLGGENYAPSCNVACTFSDVELLTCVEGPVDDSDPFYTTRWLADDGFDDITSVGTARQHNLNRPAYLELSMDLGATWTELLYSGYVTSVELASAKVYEFRLGDARRLERVTKAFKSLDVQTQSTFLGVTPIIGGPIYGGFAPWIPSVPLSVWEVQSVVTSSVSPPDGYIVLKYISGPLPPDYGGRFPVGGIKAHNAVFRVNERARPFFVEGPWIAPFKGGTFPGLRADLIDLATGLAAESDITPIAQLELAMRGTHVYFEPGLLNSQGTGTQLYLHLVRDGTGAALPSVGTRYGVLLYPREISEEYPLHWSGHPVDFIAALYGAHGVPFDATSQAATKTALGADLACALRYTNPDQTLQDIADAVCGMFGFATRLQSTSTEREFFVWRRKVASTPSLTIDPSAVHAAGEPTYRLDSGTQCNRVTVDLQLFTVWDGLTEGEGETRPHDELVAREQSIIVDYSQQPSNGRTPVADADLYGASETRLALPGQVTIGNQQSLNVQQWAKGLASEIFDRHGRGAQQATVLTLRNSDGQSARLGDAVVVDLPYLPNAKRSQTPTSQRGGTRWFRVHRRDDAPIGPALQLIDDSTGEGGNPIALTMAANATEPKQFVDVTFPLTYPTAQYEFEAAINDGSAAPTDPGLLYTILNGYVLRQDDGTQPATWTETMGPWPVGKTVWLRCRAWEWGDAPGSFGAWMSAGGGGGGPPPAPSGAISNLVLGTPYTDGVDMSWDNTAYIERVLIQARETGTASYANVKILLPTSVQYTLQGLEAGTSYDVRVVLIAATSLIEVGSALTDTFTTAGMGGAPDLSTPTRPMSWGGIDPDTRTPEPGRYGMSCRAVFGPPQMIVFEEALETAEGSGLPGTYSEVYRVAARVSGPTRYENWAPFDNLFRFLRAYAVAPGYNDSGLTAAQQVWPFGMLAAMLATDVQVADLYDVDAPTPSAGDALIFDASTGMYRSGNDPGGLMDAIRALTPPPDLTALRLTTMQTYLGLGASSTAVDDATLILATQIYGP